MSRAGLLFALLAFFAAQSGPPPADPTWPPSGVIDGQSKGIVPPMIVHKVDPRVPYALARESIDGVVTLKCVVQADGSVGEIRVATSSDRRLDQSAIASLKQWTFKPATSTASGTPIAAAITVRINIRLNQPAETPGPTSAWPAEFAKAADTTTWKDKVIDLAPMRLKLSYPPTWRVREFPADSRKAAVFANSFFTRTVTIGRPKPMANGMSTMLVPRPALENMARSILDLEFSQGHKQTLNAFGQVETSSGVWLWLDLQLSMQDLSNAPAAAAVFSEARMWMFAGSMDGQYVTVACAMLIPANPTPEHRQEQLDQTTAEFAGIMRHLSLGHR